MDLSELAALLVKRAELETRLDGFGKWIIAFGVIVAVGVTGESIFAIKEWLNNRRLQAVQRDVDRLRDLESSQQRERTANAVRMLLELQEKMKDRTFNAEQQARMVSGLQSNPRCPVGMLASVGEGEAQRFMNALADIFEKAGWNVSTMISTTDFPQAGLTLWPNSASTNACFNAVFNVLDSVGMRPAVAPMPDETQGTLAIHVGPKPE